MREGGGAANLPANPGSATKYGEGTGTSTRFDIISVPVQLAVYRYLGDLVISGLMLLGDDGLHLDNNQSIILPYNFFVNSGNIVFLRENDTSILDVKRK